MACSSSEQLKRQLAEEYGIPLLQPLPKTPAASSAHQHPDGPGAAAAVEYSALPARSNGAGQLSSVGHSEAATTGAATASAAAASCGGDVGVEARRKALELHPFNVRRAAMALQSHGPNMPEERRRWVVAGGVAGEAGGRRGGR